MIGALEGVKVLDCTQMIGAAHGATLLAEMGADVVKVEPLGGEPWRNYKSVIPKESRVFQYRNRGKRSVAVDLASPDADGVREALIRWADVLITNYTPAVIERLKIDEATAHGLNPSLIYCDMTSFGKRGPQAHELGGEVVVQALSGLQTTNQGLRNGLPQMLAFNPTEVVSGLALAFGVASALVHRERTGEGQTVTTSALMTALFLQSANMSEIVSMDTEPRRHRLAVLAAARERGATLEETFEAMDEANFEEAAKDGDKTRGPSRTDMRPGSTYVRGYKTKDGYISVQAYFYKKQFCDAIGVNDPRLEPGAAFDYDAETAIGIELAAQSEAKIASMPSAEVLAAMAAHGVPCVPIRFVDELWDDEQVLANDYIISYQHPKFGEMRGLAPMVSMSGTPTAVRRPAPGLGEHTDDVLAEAGLDAATIDELRKSNVIL